MAQKISEIQHTAIKVIQNKADRKKNWKKKEVSMSCGTNSI